MMRKPSHRLRFSCAALLWLLWPRAAWGQVTDAPLPPPPPPPPPAFDATDHLLPPALPQADGDKRLADIEEQLRALKASNVALEKEMQELRQKEQERLALPPSPLATSVLGVPVRLTGSLTLRYAYSQNSNLTDSLTAGWTQNGFRARIRLGVDVGDAKRSIVIAGIRLATGESPNPTVSFMPLGSMFQPGSFGLDQAWIAIRPFEDRERISLILGRMPNQQWRGSVGYFRTQLVWDNDINPAGVALKALLLNRGSHDSPIRLENLTAYYQVQETLDNRFVGLTGVTSLFVEQLKLVATRFFTGAVTFYDWENLNNGLSSPGIEASGVSTQTPTNATLLGSSFNQGNINIAYGPQAALGFYAPAFRIINPTVQLDLPIRYPTLGSPDVFLLGDYVHNFSSLSGQEEGVGVTIGTRMGAFDSVSRLHPLNAWVTYRYVEADATIATFADSDLGGGTRYRGFEGGIQYRILENLMPQVSYYDFYGYPLMQNHVQTLYVDLMGDF